MGAVAEMMQAPGFLALVLVGALTGCVSMRDAPRLTYRCANDLSFEARLYRDMAILEGGRGHAVLARTAGDSEESPGYQDETLHALFGLGVDARLARLEYTSIPEPVYCERILAKDEQASVRAAPRGGPRPPPPPPDPNAPIQTNIRSGEGPISGG